jgi:hypothetical protein
VNRSGDNDTAADQSVARPRRADLNRTQPGLVVALAAAYLLVAYLAIVVVDVLEVGRAWLVQNEPRRAALWVLLFEDGSPTEFFQWSLIGALIVLAALTTGSLRERGEVAAARFWRLIAVGGVLMLMEDAGNVRHRLAYHARVAGLLDAPGPWHLAVEMVWYAAIATVFLWAVVRYVSAILPARQTVVLGVAGAFVYAVAAIMSATRDIGFWYASAGRFIERRIFRTDLPLPEVWEPWHVHFFIMDYLVEESLELIGAALLVAAVLAYRRHIDHAERTSSTSSASSTGSNGLVT